MKKMNMKTGRKLYHLPAQWLPLMVAALLMGACEKNPDTDDLDNNYLVYTSYDTAAVFSDFSTFFAVDSILVIGGSSQNKAEYWNNSSSQTVVTAFADNLIDAGFTQVNDKANASLGLQLSYVTSTYYFAYSGNSPWWNSYPYYWNGYWGNGWGWYYPYPITYSYSTGSIIADIIDLKHTSAASTKVTVVWTSYICGLLSGGSLSLQRTLSAIDQAFTQSPYLKK